VYPILYLFGNNLYHRRTWFSKNSSKYNSCSQSWTPRDVCLKKKESSCHLTVKFTVFLYGECTRFNLFLMIPVLKIFFPSSHFLPVYWVWRIMISAKIFIDILNKLKTTREPTFKVEKYPFEQLSHGFYKNKQNQKTSFNNLMFWIFCSFGFLNFRVPSEKLGAYT